MRELIPSKYHLHIMQFAKAFILVLLALFLFQIKTNAQQVIIKQIELQANGDVNIYYDLEDGQEDRKYVLYLYASIDNFIQPLSNVEGEVGVDLNLGRDKKLVWHAKQELGEDFKGNVALELKGNTYIPFIALDGFEDYKVFKRGKEYDIS